MKAVTVVLVVLVGLIIGVAGIGAISYISANNDGARMENGIKAQYDQNKNVLANYGLKVAEAAQVPAMARDDLSKVVKDALSGRYGEKGSQATFQWIQEQNPTVDPKLYQKIQQLIEAGRDEFKNSQARLIDLKRNYETQQAYFWKGIWLRAAGFPKINLNDYNVVTSERTKDAFEKGVETPMQLR